MDWLFISALIAAFALPIIAFALRAYVVVLVQSKVRAQFEAELEETRSALRSAEEKIKSRLRESEAEINDLRVGLLDGRAQRFALLSQRRVENLESIWKKFNTLSKFNYMITVYSMMKHQALEKLEKQDDIRKFVMTILGDKNQDIIDASAPDCERLYVPEMIWAMYLAYLSIISAVYMHFKAFSLGVKGADELLDWSKIGELVKAVLPERATYIEKYGNRGLPILISQIEQKMIAEIKEALGGAEEDADALSRSVDILQKVEAIRQETRSNIG